MQIFGKSLLKNTCAIFGSIRLQVIAFFRFIDIEDIFKIALLILPIINKGLAVRPIFTLDLAFIYTSNILYASVCRRYLVSLQILTLQKATI